MSHLAPPPPSSGPSPASAVAPAPAGPVPAGPAPAGAPAPSRAALASGPAATVDTPALLNRWQLVAMAAVLAFAVVSAALQVVGWRSDGRGAADTEQLIRVQGIQSSLLRADALATNAFLVGGLEDPDRRADYERTIDSVQRSIASAAEAQPADRAVLAALNVQVGDYATGVAQARDNNRQAYPVGAEYLSGASTTLRTEALPLLDALATANTDRADSSMSGQHPTWLLLSGVLALGVLFWINRQLARRFRRTINKGVAAAAAIVLAVTLISSVSAWLRDSANDSLRRGDLATALSQALARTAANDAKANESLRLIRRGSGAEFEERWKTSAATVEKSLRRDTGEEWKAYTAVHARVVELDDQGEWEQAVQLAVGDEDGGSSQALDRFDAASAGIVKTSGRTVTDELRSGRSVALGLAVLTPLLGAMAAFAIARGIGERRREFA